MRRVATPAELAGLVGQELGCSAWQLVDQRRVDTFAEVTGDHQWIHTRPDLAAAGPYGTTLAHGFLALSLTSAMIFEVLAVDGVELILNKGVGRLRFSNPVRVGDRVRGRVVLTAAQSRPRGWWEAVFTVHVEVADAEPALRADLTFLYQAAPDTVDETFGVGATKGASTATI
ncbi:Acyl dehydratase [Micromonospora siamensis]|uniref:Acyl dehydratase n=1 Tax=Micromonospora siamensis TaxID=299152 RepID=A0A1C5HUI5_9ACTN|nr:Acyl dehydratase [Micromonospora siamensis]